MDQQTLVKDGHRLTALLNQDNLAPRAVLWVHNTDDDAWKLWIVPHKNLTDKREFYKELVKLISANRTDLAGLDAGDVEMISDSHPAITGLQNIVRASGDDSDVRVSNNMLNGFYLPDGIILKMDT